jgi:hypothetical protein
MLKGYRIVLISLLTTTLAILEAINVYQYHSSRILSSVYSCRWYSNAYNEIFNGHCCFSFR